VLFNEDASSHSKPQGICLLLTAGFIADLQQRGMMTMLRVCADGRAATHPTTTQFNSISKKT
jgi:hypothetical protein